MGLADTLRDAVNGCGLTQYRIAKDTGVPQQVVNRFANGERSISLETADKLLAYFRMTVSKPKKPKAGGKK